MKQTIKQLYKKHMIENNDEYNFNDYYYFKDTNNDVFGIKKSALTTNEKQLIETVYDILEESLINQKDYPIIDYLLGHSSDSLHFEQLKYYLIRTYTRIDDELHQEFIQLLKNSFEIETVISRMKDVYVVVVSDQEDLDFYHLLKSMEADFMIKLSGYESDLYLVDEFLPQRFQFDLDNLLSHYYMDEFLLSKADLVRHYLLNQLKSVDKTLLKRYLLENYENSQEMMQIINAYFKTNFNTTLAAKQCYMHRNTFINKIDKFIQETNLNIRNYDDALVVYLVMNL